MKQAHRQVQRGNNVIPFPTRRHGAYPPIVRLSPEFDGLELLYSNDKHPNTLFSLRILAWAHQQDGTTVAIVPWLKTAARAPELADPMNGRWEGYRLPDSDVLFEEAPGYKAAEMQAALMFFGEPDIDFDDDQTVIQEIPDTIGTHAVFSDDDFHTISLMEVVSWRLMANGEMKAMVIDENTVTTTPVLPGAKCLTAAQDRDDFRYFFQYGIANKLKEQDPEAIAAISILKGD